MGRLGDVLELLHTAEDRAPVLRLQARVWQHRELLMAASRAEAERRGAPAARFAVGNGPVPPPDGEHAIRLWLARPDRVRSERDDEQGTTVTVGDGRAWWRFSPALGAWQEDRRSSIAAGALGGLEPLLSPARIAGSTRIAVTGERVVAGRRGIAVRATPVSGRFLEHEAHLPSGADHHDLVVDPGRGVLLRLTSAYGGRPMHHVEVTQIAFDEQLDPSTFVFVAPEGEEIRGAPPLMARPEHTSLDEAVRRAPFTVLVPRRAPLGASLRVTLLRRRERPRVPSSVDLRYDLADGAGSVSISENDETLHRESAGPDWRTETRDGRRLSLRTIGRQAHVRTEHLGVPVMLVGDNVPLSTLAAMAASLEPAVPSPPELV